MELAKWLALLPAVTRKGLSIESATHIYHISTDPGIKRFMPMVGTRQLPGENRTVPRVCCAASIVDAIRGHSAVAGQAINRWKEGKPGVFYIYRFPFRQYVKPDKTIVPDVELTRELWVVPNDPSTSAFKAPIVGCFYVDDIAERHVEGELHKEFKVVLHTQEPVRLTDRLELNGYGQIELEYYHQSQSTECKPISAEEYKTGLLNILKHVVRG